MSPSLSKMAGYELNVRNFSLYHRIQTDTGGPPSLLPKWISTFLSLRIKRPEREPDNLRPSITEVKYVWSVTSTSLLYLCNVMFMDRVKSSLLITDFLSNNLSLASITKCPPQQANKTCSKKDSLRLL